MIPATTARAAPVAPAREAGDEVLTRIFEASMVPFETAARMRKHFRIHHRYWTLIPSL
jgi:hypothetical protein